MKKKSKKVTPPKSLRESFNMAFQKNKNNKNTSSAAGKPVTMFKRRADAIKQTIEENPRAVKRLAEQNRKRKAQKKNIGGFLETFSPVYSVAKGRGPISDALSALGPVAGLSGLAAKEQKKKRKMKEAKKADMMAGMQANMMPGADRMAGGGKMVKSKRTRSIDGIASKGKTRATQR